MLDINVNNIFFKSYSIDPNSGHSIYVFDSTYLPEPDEIGNDKQLYDVLIDQLMDSLITKLPSSPYSLVVFSNGFSQKKISWVYGIKMFSKLPKELKFYLQKTYIVHESFFIRTVYQVLSNAMNFKFLTINSKYNNVTSSLEEDTIENSGFSIVHVPDLTTLSRLIDITRLRISLNVYLHDYEINEYIDVPVEYFSRLSDIGKRKYRQLIFDKIFKKLWTQSVNHELIFQRPGSYKKVNIFLDIIERNNYIDLSQWDIYSLASVFLHFIKNKANPLVPIDLIDLPIQDDFDYTVNTFKKIIEFNNYYHLFLTIFPLFTSILKASEITKHDSKTLSRALTPSLCKEKISINNNDRLQVGTRFIKNLLENFEEIVRLYEQSIRQGRSVKRQEPIRITSQSSQSSQISSAPMLPKPRKASPTKYSNSTTSLGSDGSKSPSREESPIKSFSSLKLNSSIALNAPPLIAPQLKPKKSIPNLSNISQRVSSTDSTTLLSEGAEQDLTDDNSGRKVSQSNETDPIRLMVTDNGIPYKPNKFEKFDKELKIQKKKKEVEIVTKEKFSQVPFSDIPATSKGVSKVSKLAALYEERLQGLQVMNEIMNNK